MSKDTKKDRELPKSNASGNNKAFKFRTLDENAEEKNSIDVKSNDKDTKECSSKDFNKNQVPKECSSKDFNKDQVTKDRSSKGSNKDQVPKDMVSNDQDPKGKDLNKNTTQEDKENSPIGVFVKAGYTTFPVACGWAGAIFEVT